MIKKLKLFQTDSEYTAFTGTTAFVKPNVSHCVQENHVHYNPYVHDYSKDYLTIVSLEDNNVIYLKASSTAVTKTISASTDNGETWTGYTSSTSESGTTIATLNNGDKLLIKGENTVYGSSNAYNQFKSTNQFEVNGNIMSLVSGDSFVNANELTNNNNYIFRGVFSQSENLISAENLVLPATTLANYCYYQMFTGSRSLTTAPSVLPATTLKSNCYYRMFNNCTSLTTIPQLPATTLASQCYNQMFQGCTNLTTAPELPATTLAQQCYDSMFYNCTSLITAPELPATTLANNCYYYMFYGCTNLTTAPELSATTLAQQCYQGMFNGCTSLNSITCLATNISASNCTTDWVKNVAASGTFIKAASMSSWTTGTSGIPSNWTVQPAS